METCRVTAVSTAEALVEIEAIVHSEEKPGLRVAPTSGLYGREGGRRLKLVAAVLSRQRLY
jgi:hypothetical protein